MTNSEIILWAGAVGAVVAALVSSIVMLINGWRQRIAEANRHKVDTESAHIRHFRELALEAAIVDWKHRLEVVEKWEPDRQRIQSEIDRPEVEPFDYFLIKKLKMIQTFGDGTISVADLPARFEDMKKFHRFFRSKNRSTESCLTK